MNKKYTFRNEIKNGHAQLIKFLIITLLGLWVIQPIIIEGINYLAGPTSAKNYVVLFVGKSIATVVTLIWNYLLYRKFVFGDSQQ